MVGAIRNVPNGSAAISGPGEREENEMNPKHVLTVATVCSILALTAPMLSADEGWTRQTPAGRAFSVEVPGERIPAERPALYEYRSDQWIFMVDVQPSDNASRQVLERGDRRAIKQMLEAERDTFISDLEGKRTGGSSARESDDNPSIRFSVETDSSLLVMQVVITREHYYYVVAQAPKGTPDDEAKRFVRSFRLDAANTNSRQ